MKLENLIRHLHHGLIVSCQALPDEPLFGAGHMAAMARAAVSAGAVGIRANGPEDIVAIRKEVHVPVIGIYKVDLPGCEVRITPALEYALQVAEAGADLIAIDATLRPHPRENVPASVPTKWAPVPTKWAPVPQVQVKELIEGIHRRCGLPVLADISTLEEGLAAAESGADFVATTLSGYTAYSPAQAEPDFDLLAQLVKTLAPRRIPVIAEGRIATPAQATRALSLGAHAVVVGSAITRPQVITARFVEAMQEGNQA